MTSLWQYTKILALMLPQIEINQMYSLADATCALKWLICTTEFFFGPI